MELTLLNNSLEPVHVLDSFKSLIWTDRYSDLGDLELYISFNSSLLAFLKEDYFVTIPSSDRTMIIEELQIESDPEIGPTLLVKGRSLESILLRRIVWNQTILDGNFQTEIERLLTENVINPSDADRQISNLVFEASTDPLITALTIEGQYHGEFIFDVIKAECDKANIGFKMVLNEANEFVFSLYIGSNHSYDQEDNPYVVFSEEFENLINTDSVYTESSLKYKTIVLVIGEGEGTARLTSTASIPSGAGTELERREMFLDGSSISRTIDGGTLSEADYQSQLSQKGLEELANNQFLHTFDGQIESTNMYLYGVDFGMGDIVQLVTEYNIEGKVQVVELIQSQNESGISVCPTFKNVT